MVLQHADPSLPEVKTDQFIIQLGAMVAAVVPIAILPVLPSFIFAPVGRGAVAATIVRLIAALAFYRSAFGSIAFSSRARRRSKIRCRVCKRPSY